MSRKLLIFFLPLIVAGILGTVYYQKIYNADNASPEWEVVGDTGVEAELPPPIPEEPPALPDPTVAQPPEPTPEIQEVVEEIQDTAISDDQALLDAAGKLTSNPLLKVALSQEAALKRFVQLLDAIANGKIPTVSLGFVGETPLFEAETNAEGYLAATAKTKQRLSPLVEAATNVPPAKAAEWFTLAEPRLQIILEDLGYQDLTIRQLLTNAVTVILQVPIFNFDPELTPTGKPNQYEYKDSVFQELNEFQKAMVRLGPENCQKLRNTTLQISKELKLFK